LSREDRQDKAALMEKIEKSEIPADIFNCFRVVGPKDKLVLYEHISNMSPNKIANIRQVCIKLVQSNARHFDWAGFQMILDLIYPIIKEEQLKTLIDIRVGRQQYSLIIVLLSSYLEGGFMQMVRYYTTDADPIKTKDESIKTVANFVYNIFKYHLVKYLGLFDIFYRYWTANREGTDIDDIPGLGLLLQKLEYNAILPIARKVSDYGVPFKLVDCYDSNGKYDKSQFDSYERYVDMRISELIK